MDRYHYLLLLAGCFAITLPLEFLFQARVYRRPARFALAVLPVLVVFSGWDVLGIARGLWRFSSRYTTGIRLPFHLPLEELVFFVVIPACALLTYESVGVVMRRLGRRGGDA
jgi:lycopene cyclase domain-containing protein